MKIFNKEDNVEVVYVQREDLIYVLHYCINATDDIVSDFLLEKKHTNKNNKNEFICFSKEPIIEFFRKQDWVIDYKQYRKLSMEDIMFKDTEIVNDINRLRDALGEAETMEKKRIILSRLALVSYKARDIKRLYDYKDNLIDFEVPLAIDSDGFSSKVDRYVVNASLEPGKVLIHRDDNKPLEEGEEVPTNIIQIAMTMALMEHNPDDNTFNEYKKINYRTKDNMYMVVGYDYRKALPINYSSSNKSKKENFIQRVLKKIRGR